ncbi:hypothetical protein K505DRAFT_365945 [Melanomma pulvis-pyrius CBS 109.77]|uniref:AMP-activated protein kinase glycogen-binding domain-containing protein n=1 Tax=Melanomma pulvis-pyrius CBS 109.77 TaxID=1314802 RepID=A0A6A6WYR3_9PLEO|nr:hypothetical protein K505DRAFT_365945 [Melanomma pulvis-pyrius CBS 109.77]
MSFLKHRPHRKHIRALLSGHRQRPPSASATTDDIPPPTDAYDHIRALTRTPTDPTSSKRPGSSSTLRSVLSASTAPPNVTMTGHARITFSQPGVQSPVYVVTSLSNPPWETLELSVADEKTDSGQLLFARQFDHVSEGSYQYKIRIGEGYWVVDESKDTATDGSGNRNNVINVKAEVDPPSLRSSIDASTAGRQDSVQHHDATPSSLSTRDNATPDVSRAPTPFVVVDKVADKDQPEYGHVEPAPLREDASKRTADAEPDFVNILPETSPEKQQKADSQPVPVVIVEKTDDNLSHGDDFGKDATSAQKVAHELRAADAPPDKIVVSPEAHSADPPTEEADVIPKEQTARLSYQESNKHESKSVEEQKAPPNETLEPEIREAASTSSDSNNSQIEDQTETPENIGVHPISALEETEEDSARSSTDPGSSQVGLNTPSEDSEIGREDEAANESLDELDNSPLLSHEPGISEDGSVGELDNRPLLSHETGFSGYEGSEEVSDDNIIQRNSEAVHYDEDVGYNDKFDSERAPTFAYETTADEDDGSEAPLLPHERDSHDKSVEGSASGLEDGEQIFPYEAAPATHFFAKRTNTGGLPHRLPSSDEEDDNLDSSLERFPTSREEILERVATIGSHLPIDETREWESPHSPEFSVLSQACSSVELAPTLSNTSLKPVAEEEDLDGSDAENDSADGVLVADAESKEPAQKLENGNKDVQSRSEPTETSDKQDNTHTQHNSEQESVQKDDGTKNSPLDIGKLYSTIATPAKALNPLTPPLTPERKTRDATGDAVKISPTVEGSQETGEGQSKSREDEPPTARGSHSPEPKGDWLQAFLRFLTACLGGRRQASGTILVVSFAVVAYYYVYGSKG